MLRTCGALKNSTFSEAVSTQLAFWPKEACPRCAPCRRHATNSTTKPSLASAKAARGWRSCTFAGTGFRNWPRLERSQTCRGCALSGLPITLCAQSSAIATCARFSATLWVRGSRFWTMRVSAVAFRPAGNCCEAARWSREPSLRQAPSPPAAAMCVFPTAVSDAERGGTCPRDDSSALEGAVKAAATRFPSHAIPLLSGPPQSRRVPAAGFDAPDSAHVPAPTRAGGRAPAVARRDLLAQALEGSQRAAMTPPAFPTGRPAAQPPGALGGAGPTTAASGNRDGLDSAASRALAQSSAVRAGHRSPDDGPAGAMLTAVMALVGHLDAGSLRAVRTRCDAMLAAGGAGRPSE